MKKVITMVGTSIFENYKKTKEDTTFQIDIKSLKNKPEKSFKDHKIRISEIKEKVKDWMSYESPYDISAEVKSLLKLHEELKESFRIYLLYSDTILSRLAAEIIEEFITEKAEDFEAEDVRSEKIADLQVDDRKRFIDGMCNLIRKIYDIAQYSWEDVIINITGGFKATIPYFTILAQVNRCPLYYIFEETDSLIKIPYVPVSIDWEVFEENEELFFELEDKGIKELPSLSFNQRSRIESLIEVADDLICLNPLGITLWEKFKEKWFYFFTTDEVWEEIKRQRQITRILKEKFWNEQIRQSKTKEKNGHIQYDDGDNPFRIFYFEEQEKVYIYKTFENHDKAERFLKETDFLSIKKDYKQKASLRKVEKDIRRQR